MGGGPSSREDHFEVHASEPSQCGLACFLVVFGSTGAGAGELKSRT